MNRWRGPLVGLIVVAAAACGGSTAKAHTPGSSAPPTSSSATTAQTVKSTSPLPPAATTTLPDLKIGQTVVLNVRKVTGWGEPRALDPSILDVVADASDSGTWKLTLRAKAVGTTSVLAMADPCAGVADKTACAGARSAAGWTYLVVTVAK